MSNTASFVLVADYFYHEEDGESVRYKRGDTVELGEREAKNLLKVGAIAKSGDDAAKRATARPGPEPLQPGTIEPDGFNQSAYGTAAANSGLGPDDASGGELSEEQRAEGAVERPPQSATVGVWREYAVNSDQLTEDEADGLTKPELQERLK